MAAYLIVYEFSIDKPIEPNDSQLKLGNFYTKECIAEVQVSTNVEPQCLNAARLDFIDDYGMLSPFSLASFQIISFTKKN